MLNACHTNTFNPSPLQQGKAALLSIMRTKIAIYRSSLEEHMVSDYNKAGSIPTCVKNSGRRHELTMVKSYL